MGKSTASALFLIGLKPITSLTWSSGLSLGFGINVSAGRDAFAFPIANITFLIKPYRHGTWRTLSLLVDAKLCRQYDVYYPLAFETHMESDWRKFRDMVPKLRERYLAERNAHIVGTLTDPNKKETERFWDSFEMMEKEAEVLRQCLDGHSRSKLWLFMISMLRVGMLKREDLSQFSEVLQRELAHEMPQEKG